MEETRQGILGLWEVCDLYAVLGVGEGGVREGGEHWDFYGDLVMFWLMMLCGMNVGGRERRGGGEVVYGFLVVGKGVMRFTVVGFIKGKVRYLLDC